MEAPHFKKGIPPLFSISSNGVLRLGVGQRAVVGCVSVLIVVPREVKADESSLLEWS